jgi:hypothetical protein
VVIGGFSKRLFQHALNAAKADVWSAAGLLPTQGLGGTQNHFLRASR